MSLEEEARVVEQIRTGREQINRELSKVIVGQHDVIEELLISLFAGGHCLITGAPGLAKTLLVSSVAKVFHLNFQRIQFTPDLMPADISGTEILEQTEDGRRQITVRQRTDFHQRAVGRRDQSHASENASRTAGSDAGASGHRNWSTLQAG